MKLKELRSTVVVGRGGGGRGGAVVAVVAVVAVKI
jgi:hypothetical protein